MRASHGTFLGMMLLITSPLLAQNPWNRVPQLPNTCYSGNDTFGEDAGKVEGELSEAVERQKVANEEVAQRWTSLDPAQQQAKVMAFMQKNPAGAADAVQQLQAGFGAPVTAYPSGKTPADFQAELKQLVEEYLADAKRQLSPKPLDERTKWAGWNAKYVSLCEAWFAFAARKGSDPRFSGFLARYKEYLTQEYIPQWEQSHASQKRFFDSMGIPTTGYESWATLDAVRMYLAALQEAFGGRETKPLGT